MKNSIKKNLSLSIVTLTIIFGGTSFYILNKNNLNNINNLSSINGYNAYLNKENEYGHIKQIENTNNNQFIIYEDNNGIDHLFAVGKNSYNILDPNAEKGEVLYDYVEIDVDGDGEPGYSDGTLNQVASDGYTVLLSTTDDNGVDHLFSWGNNGSNQTGLPNSANGGDNVIIDPQEVDLDGGQEGYDGTINDISISYVDSLVSTTDSDGVDHVFNLSISTSEDFFEFDLNGSNVKMINANPTFGYIVTNDGEEDHLFSYGSNSFGCLGTSDDLDYVALELEEVDINQNGTFGDEGEIIDISSSPLSVSVITNDSDGYHVYSWGDNNSKNIFINEDSTIFFPKERTYFNDLGYSYEYIENNVFSQYVVGFDESGNYHLYSWGFNSNGSSGIENQINSAYNEKEIDIDGDGEYGDEGDIIDISSSSNSSISIVVNNGNIDNLYSWGLNDNGQIGLKEDVSIANTPTKVDLIPYNGDILIDSVIVNKESITSNSASINYELSSTTENSSEFDPVVESVTVIGFNGDGEASEETNGELNGTIELTNLNEDTNYDNLQLQVTFSGASGLDQIITESIEEFTTETEYTNDIQIDSAAVNENSIAAHSASIDYELSTTSALKSDAQVESVTVIGFNGDGEASEETNGELSGTIELTNLNERTTYSNLKLEVTYSGKSGENITVESDIDEFTTESEYENDIQIDSASVNDNSITTDSASIDYTLSTTSALKSDAHVEKVTVIGFNNGNGIASEDTDGEMSGTIELTNLNENTSYSNLQLQVTYSGKSGENITVESDIAPFTTDVSYDNDIQIDYAEVSSKDSTSASIDYSLSYSSFLKTPAQVESVTVTGFDVDSNASATTVTDGKMTGTVELTNLDENTPYENLMLEVTYNGKAGQDETIYKEISPFTTDPIYENDIAINNVTVTDVTWHSATVNYELKYSSSLRTNAQVTSVTVTGFGVNSSASATTVTDGEMTGTIKISNLEDGQTYDNLRLEVTFIGKSTGGKEQSIHSSIESIETPVDEYPNSKIIVSSLLLLTVIEILICLMIWILFFYKRNA